MAEVLGYPLGDASANLAPDQQAAIDQICLHKHGIPERRLERLAQVMPMSREIMGYSKDHVREAVGPEANPAFAAAFIMAVDWPGKSFCRDHFYSGHDIVGVIPDFKLWREKDPDALAKELEERVPVAVLAGSNEE